MIEIFAKLLDAILVAAGVFTVLRALDLVQGWARDFDSDWGAK